MWVLPAPKTVLELSACQCHKSCRLLHCQCLTDGLTCTPASKLQTCENVDDEADLPVVPDNGYAAADAAAADDDTENDDNDDDDDNNNDDDFCTETIMINQDSFKDAICYMVNSNMTAPF